MKLALHVQHVNRERVLVLSDTFDNFTALRCHLHGNVALPWFHRLSQSVFELGQCKLRAHTRQIRSDQSSLTADHVAGCTPAFALVDFHSILSIAGYFVVGGRASEIANISHDPPDVLVWQTRSGHSAARYAVLNGIEDGRFTESEVAASSPERGCPVALRTVPA